MSFGESAEAAAEAEARLARESGSRTNVSGALTLHGSSPQVARRRTPHTPQAAGRLAALEARRQGLTPSRARPAESALMERGGPFHGRIAVLQN